MELHRLVPRSVSLSTAVLVLAILFLWLRPRGIFARA